MQASFARMKRWLLIILTGLFTAVFIALGVWQLERREWKLALIARVDARVHAAPVAAPGPAEWPALTRENAEYRRVTVSGHFLPGHETLVQALTALGAGHWVMAPLQTNAGFIVLVNRGFVPPEKRDPATRRDAATAGAPVTVTGLLRMSEPGGGFLRANAPTANRWYSRDVAAISHTEHLSNTAPYFIDAEAARGGPAAGAWPAGGLTVTRFRNSHLSYAFTWLALAVMTAVFCVRLVRRH